MSTKKRPLSRTTDRGSDKFILRLPDGFRDQLAELAKEHGRSMNAEAVTALAVYFTDPTLGRRDPPEGVTSPHRLPDVYELLLNIGTTVERLSREVEKLKNKIGRP